MVNSFNSWIQVSNGWVRTFRVKDQKLAQHIKLNAMVLGIRIMLFGEQDNGYWQVKLFSIAKPSPEQTRQLSKSKLY